MRTCVLVACFLALVGCGSSGGGTSDSAAPPSIVGTWAYASADGTTGMGATFTSDGRYEWQHLALTSATSGDDEMELGTYVTSGSSLVLTPQKSSCPGTHPQATLGFVLTTTTLTIVQPTGETVMQADKQSTSNFSVTLGCFGAGGFTPQALTPVSN